MKKEIKTELNVINLDEINVSNLPELQGLREAQEQLVLDCPYVEIIDNSTFEIAKRNRTSLLKGRTSLESQDKLIASKFTLMRKKVKEITDDLISITQPHEDLQQIEVKRYESIKENERLERERLENLRIESIKNKISEIETSSYEIIQKMTFKSILSDFDILESLENTDFDFEEFDILWQQSVKRVNDYYNSKITDLNNAENQRIENESLAKIAKESQEKLDLQNKRLTEIMPYIPFVGELDLTKLSEIENFDVILYNANKYKSEKDKTNAENQSILDAENLAKEQKEKEYNDKIFEIRKSRISEIGFESLNNFNYINSEFEITITENIYDFDPIDFENLIERLKTKIIVKKEEIEQDIISKENAKKLQKDIESKNDERVYLLSNDKWLIRIFIENIIAQSPIPKVENEEMKTVLQGVISVLEETKKELLINLKNY